jgi:tetratricopeptide (TPR) repeat protein
MSNNRVLEILIEAIKSDWKKRDLDAALRNTNLFLKMCREQSLQFPQADGLVWLGRIRREKSNYEGAIVAFKEARDIYQRSLDLFPHSLYPWMMMGWAMMDRQQPENALKELREVEAILEVGDFSQDIDGNYLYSQTLILISNCLYELGRDPETLLATQIAHRECEKQHRWGEMLNMMGTIAMTEAFMGNAVKAISELEQALSFLNTNSNKIKNVETPLRLARIAVQGLNEKKLFSDFFDIAKSIAQDDEFSARLINVFSEEFEDILDEIGSNSSMSIPENIEKFKSHTAMDSLEGDFKDPFDQRFFHEVLNLDAWTLQNGDIGFRLKDYGVFILEKERSEVGRYRLNRPGYSDETDNMSKISLLEIANRINSENFLVKAHVSEAQNFISFNVCIEMIIDMLDSSRDEIWLRDWFRRNIDYITFSIDRFHSVK